MHVQTLWDHMLHAVSGRVGAQDVEIWLAPCHPIGLEGGRLTVEVPNRYYADWIGDNYEADMIAEASRQLGVVVRLEYVSHEDPHTADAPTPVVRQPSVGDAAGPMGINPRQTFASFVVGECNKFAHSAARNVADNPTLGWNPLFIYGSTGLGKTHLMQAIANEVIARHSRYQVAYTTAEEFMNEMINGLRFKRTDDFRMKYRRKNLVLLVDDVQFLRGREATQEEFFHTFNALLASGGHIVLTSDVVPSEIDKLEPRLRTRFEGGLLADMQAPTKEVALAILHTKADNLSITIPSDVADVIADKAAGNVRELEGVLTRVAALHRFHSEPVTLDFVRRRLPNLVAVAPPTLTVPAIIAAVAQTHNLRAADLIGSGRAKSLTRPRHIAMYLSRTYTSLSLPELGREFGNRDHTTILHGVNKIKDERPRDADLDHQIKVILANLGIR